MNRYLLDDTTKMSKQEFVMDVAVELIVAGIPEGAECTYDEVANTYDVDLLQICQPNEDMLIVDGNIKNIFNHVDVLQFYQTDKITNSHNFPKSITHFNIYACCNFEYFDGKDCKFSDSKIFNKSHCFQHDNRLEIITYN